MTTPRFFALCLLLLLVPAAHAHIGHGTGGSGGFTDGLLHPVTGLDHVVAMIAVGLWGAQLGRPAIWVLPITFPLVMAIGGFAGILGVPLPGVVMGIALSGLILGVMVAAALRPPLWIAAIIVAAFAIFHGHAHGTAMPLAGAPLAFGAGFVVTTGVLHLCGVAIGLLTRWPVGATLIRLGGGTIAAVGAFYLALYFGLIIK